MDELALARAEEGEIAGARWTVQRGASLTDHPLFKAPNVIVTPTSVPTAARPWTT